jgi:hypothetical protein
MESFGNTHRTRASNARLEEMRGIFRSMPPGWHGPDELYEMAPDEFSRIAFHFYKSV